MQHKKHTVVVREIGCESNASPPWPLGTVILNTISNAKLHSSNLTYYKEPHFPSKWMVA